jgi:hypothetical protein
VGGACAGSCDKTRLGDNPVFLNAAQWGTVSVSDLLIRPDSQYRVAQTCDFPADTVSEGMEATTWPWGDTNGDLLVNVLDISTVVNFLKGLFAQATYEGTNVWPCEIDRSVNVIDLSEVVDAVRGGAMECADACP